MAYRSQAESFGLNTCRLCIALTLLVSGGAAFAQDAHEKAKALLQVGNYMGAIDLLEESLNKNPNDLEARYLLARALLWGGRHQEALTLFVRLAEARPENSDYLLGLGQALLATGRYEEAERVLSHAHHIAPMYRDVEAALEQARERLAVSRPGNGSRTVEPALAVGDDVGVTSVRQKAAGLSATYDALTGSYDPWRGLRVAFSNTARGHIGGFGYLGIDQRFGEVDYGVAVSLILPLGNDWELQPEFGVASEADFLPHYYVDMSVQRTISRIWLARASMRSSNYPDARVDRFAIEADRYGERWRSSYIVNVTRLGGVDSLGYDIRVARPYGKQSEAGVQFVFGREATLTETGPVTSDVRSCSVFGRHKLAESWRLNWTVTASEQGEFYSRYGVSLGVERSL
ncbi:tetratricopeptide repeat protein [Lysobacter sp. GCM10012299]|uniref:tetratricopeptide repeat protein n=1 Tax=Lysobacter sp. GCM10012299 TaxID=3317333 RepID=UPI00361316CA